MAGRPAQDFVHPDDRAQVLAGMAELGGTMTQKTLQHRAVRRDGTEIWVETNFQLVHDEDGAGNEMVAVIRDISERKTMEAQLRAAQAAAEAAAAVKGEFLANMSHELRTPLTAVLGFSKLVSEQPELTPLTRRFADRLTTAGRLLLATVNDILDFSKLEAGQVDINLEVASPAACIGETVGLLEETAHQKGLALTFDGIDGLPANLRLDADRLRQIVMNLAGNAVKFTSSGSVRIEAGYDDVAEKLTVRVHDTGPGIAEPQRIKLFQRFSQVDGSSTRRHGGTGLGLAICKGLVEAMGGEIGASSVVGQGSCFWFAIPASPAAAAAMSQGSAKLPGLPTGCRILLADDNEINRKLVKAFLAPHGAEIAEAVNGAEAITMASAEPFDVILMDLRMPVLGGIEASARIRGEDGPNAGVPILAFSADMFPKVPAGLFDGVLTKPISPANLLLAICNATKFETGAAHDAAA